MKEKLRQIIAILKGKAVSVDYFKKEVLKLATINGEERYNGTRVQIYKHSHQSKYETTFSCYIDGFNHTPYFATIEESLSHMRNQINAPNVEKKEIEVLL